MDTPHRIASLLNSHPFIHFRRLLEGRRIRGVMTVACLGIAATFALSAAPVVSVVKPTSVAVGAFSLTVTGSGFDSGAVVLFDGVELATTRRNAKRLIADGAATAEQVGPVEVFVKNPDLTTSNVVNVEVVDGGPGGGGGGKGVWLCRRPSASSSGRPTLARWFDVADVDLPTVFPNIANFPSSNMGFMAPPA